MIATGKARATFDTAKIVPGDWDPSRDRNRQAARQPRKSTLRAQLRALGLASYAEVKANASELYEKCTKVKMTGTLSKLKREKTLP